MEIAPNVYVPVVQSLAAQGKRKEATELCLSLSAEKPTPELAMLMASLMTVTDEPFDELPAARQAIQQAAKEYPDNVQVQQAEAVMLASRGEYDPAIAIFRRIVELDKNNALAMNNLATLLAEKPNQRGEALEYIERAIEIAGRQPSLLDTRGTVLLKLGDHQQAIASLEEATAGGSADARYYLHLAAAYQLAQRHADAQLMLDEARASGLDKFVLTEDDRRLLESLDKQFRAAVLNGNSAQ